MVCTFIFDDVTVKRENRKLIQDLVPYLSLWVPSIGKSGFQICNQTRNLKVDFNAEISVFGFPLFHVIGKAKKGFEKLSLRTAVLHAHG